MVCAPSSRNGLFASPDFSHSLTVPPRQAREPTRYTLFCQAIAIQPKMSRAVKAARSITLLRTLRLVSVTNRGALRLARVWVAGRRVRRKTGFAADGASDDYC